MMARAALGVWGSSWPGALEPSWTGTGQGFIWEGTARPTLLDTVGLFGVLSGRD